MGFGYCFRRLFWSFFFYYRFIFILGLLSGSSFPFHILLFLIFLLFISLYSIFLSSSSSSFYFRISLHFRLIASFPFCFQSFFFSFFTITFFTSFSLSSFSFHFRRLHHLRLICLSVSFHFHRLPHVLIINLFISLSLPSSSFPLHRPFFIFF